VRYQQDQQVAIRERLRRLLSGHWRDFAQNLRLATDWIAAQPSLVALLTAAERVEPDLDFEDWYAALQQRAMDWPNQTEDGQAALIWQLMKKIREVGDGGQIRTLMFNFGSRTDDATRQMAERLFAPLFDYLTERIGTDSSILYVLERYVRRVEWFERENLYRKYEENKPRGESVYDLDLRRFLFSEGINMPFSQAKSASGLSDVLTELDSEDPLVCEVKLFTSDKRGVISGLHQVVQYAHDYTKTAAYLVIINLSGRPLELPSDAPDGVWPRHLDLAGVRTYLVPIRALPQESASKLGKAAPVTFSREDLVDPDAS
jgi:hypothetical protein